ncbi:hypothetical protein GCM10022291_34930 [Postechiella marina]|uniref:DUF2007 domain-containing protein n=1 Tax=Postechiella marina TaxID=943941 RepID=A0ABP8CID5_9FLAO
MSNSNYTKIFHGNFITVQRIVSALEKVDINAIIKEQTETGLIQVFGGSNSDYQEVYVHKDELEKAIAIVKVESIEKTT